MSLGFAGVFARSSAGLFAILAFGFIAIASQFQEAGGGLAAGFASSSPWLHSPA